MMPVHRTASARERCFSSTAMRCPKRARFKATREPAGPAPTTRASYKVNSHWEPGWFSRLGAKEAPSEDAHAESRNPERDEHRRKQTCLRSRQRIRQGEDNFACSAPRDSTGTCRFSTLKPPYCTDDHCPSQSPISTVPLDQGGAWWCWKGDLPSGQVVFGAQPLGRQELPHPLDQPGQHLSRGASQHHGALLGKRGVVHVDLDEHAATLLDEQREAGRRIHHG